MKKKRNRFYLALTFFILALTVPVFYSEPQGGTRFSSEARGSYILGSGFATAEDLPPDLPAIDLPEKPSLPAEALAKAGMPGRTEGTGTSFEVKDSDYLNIKLTSTDEIKIMLESVPRMISLNIEAMTIASTTLTIAGLESNKIYYKYEDSYKNGVEIFSDENGVYNWTQDLSQPHHVWFQEEKSTIFLPADCSTYGTWNSDNLTCTLTQDLNQSVEIIANSITLDCNGHSITGTDTGYGIYINDKLGVYTKNCIISGFSYGINSLSTTNTTLDNNQVSAGRYNYGITFIYSNNGVISNTKINSGRIGIYLWNSHHNNLSNNNVSLGNGEGITFKDSPNNTLIGNTLTGNGYSNLYLISSPYNVLRGNTFSGSNTNFYISGSELSHFTQDIDTSNTTDEKPIYYLVNESNKTVDSSSNAGFVGVVNSINITVKDLTLAKNGYGVLFVNTKNSRIENISTSNVYYGIYLFDSSENTLLNNNAGSNSGWWVYESFDIFIKNSPNNILRNNKLIPFSENFYISGIDPSHFIQDIDTSNKIVYGANEYPIYYLVNQRDKVIPPNAGFVALVNSENITVKNLSLKKNNSHGVLLVNTKNSRIEHVSAPFNQYGIYLLDSSNNTILNNYLDRSTISCIYLSNSSDNVITGNEVESSHYFFIELDGSHNNLITNNKIKKGAWGISYGNWGAFGNYGIHLTNSNGNTISNNELGVFFLNYSAIYLDYSDNNIISNNILTVSWTSTWGANISIIFSSYNTISMNTINSALNGGIYLMDSTYNTVAENTIINNPNSFGIFLGYDSKFNKISKNESSSNNSGIHVAGASDNEIVDNNLSNNSVSGITFTDLVWNGRYLLSENNKILNNNINFNKQYGIIISGVSYYYDNKFYHNNFIDNASQPWISYGARNVFDNGYPSGGNYWSDYTGIDINRGSTQDQPGSDGIGDTPYIFTRGQDRYPFMEENGWKTSPPEDQVPVCNIELQQNGNVIDKISINEFFDIYAGDSTDDTGIKEVRFTSDDSQDGNSPVPDSSSWTKWYDWVTSSDDWNKDTKIKRWSFTTIGDKEVWVEVKDTLGQTSQCSANISIIPWSFAIITDLHIGWGIPDYDSEGYYDSGLGQEYFVTERLRKAVQKINENYKNPEYNIKFVVVLGDIADTGEYSEFLKAREILNELEIPYVPIIGNHDIWPYTQKINVDPDGGLGGHIRSLSVKSKAEGEEALGDEYFEEVFWKGNSENVQKIRNLFSSFERQEDLEGYNGADYFHNYYFSYVNINFVSLDFASRWENELLGFSPVNSDLNIETMNWFIEKLKNTTEKTIVFTHYPFSDHLPDIGFISSDLENIIGVIDNYSGNILNFAGHMHLNFVREPEDKSYAIVTTEAAIQSETEYLGVPFASFGKFIRIVQIEENAINYNKFIDMPANAIRPYFTVNPEEVAVGQKITIKGYTKNLNPEEILAYNWDFGSNYSSECITPDGEFPKCTVTYSKPGSYNISLKVTPKNDPTYSEEISWTLNVKEERINPFKIFLPLPGFIPLLNGEEGYSLALEENAQNTTEWVVVTKVTSPAKLVGAFNTHFENATSDIDLSNLIVDTDITKRKSVLYMDEWPELIENSKILFIPSTGAGSIYICPNAASLEEVNPLCSDIMVLGTEEEKDGIIVTTTVYNGQEYYMVFGVTGTGGGEFGDSERYIKDLNDYIRSLPDTAFINNPLQRKEALQNKLEEVFVKIENQEYQDALNKLQKDIWAKFDGDLATTAKDWIISTEAILELSTKMNELIVHLRDFL